MTRFLVAGDWHSDLHEEEVRKSLIRLGHEVDCFKWHGYFNFNSEAPRSPAALVRRVQNKYAFGPAVGRLNSDFLHTVRACRPEVVFIYRGSHVYRETLQEIRSILGAKCRILGYNNDDPFSPAQPALFWRHFLRAVPEYDLMLAYRHANLGEYRRAGARRVELLRSWYVPDRSHPVSLSEAEKAQFDCDVVFVGHYEDDQRLACLEDIVRRGFSVRLFGPTKYWAEPLASSSLLRHLAPTRMVWGADYNRALCGAKVALCFLSKLNRDTYTRRCFEIPATRTLMLSEYSDDLASLYREGVEADFFRDRDEMMRKIEKYIGNSAARQRVASAGHAKVASAGHDIDSRMRSLLQSLEAIA